MDLPPLFSWLVIRRGGSTTLNELNGWCARRDVQPRDDARDLGGNCERCERDVRNEGETRGADAVSAERANPVAEDAMDRIVGGADGADAVAAGIVHRDQAVLVPTLDLVRGGRQRR